MPDEKLRAAARQSPLPGYLPTLRIAELSGVTQDHVSLVCREGKVEALKLGRDWLVSVESWIEYRKNRHPGGRPSAS